MPAGQLVVAGRSTGWYHKRFAADVPGWLRKIGETVLGRVSERQRASGLGVVDEFVRLPDGSTIRATIRGAQPVLELVWSGGAGEPEVCTLYMESGCLDLGANLSAANPTWYPTFADGQKVLHFGTLTDCDTLGGLNGEFRYNATQGSGSCIQEANDGEPVEALCLAAVEGLVSSGEKAAAQGRIPASCFTGLLRKYVQALYGCPTAAYSASNPVRLRVHREDRTFFDFPIHAGDTGYSVGLCDFGKGDYWFISLPTNGGSTGYANKGVLTRCGEVLKRALFTGTFGRDKEKRDEKFERVESYLLTQLLPDKNRIAFYVPPQQGNPAAYGWHFDAKEARAAAVLFRRRMDATGEAALAVATISRSEEGDISVGVAEPEVAQLHGHLPTIMAQRTYSGVAVNRLSEVTVPSTTPPSANVAGPLECPLYCWYEDGALKVLRSRFTTAAKVQETSVAGCPYSPSTGTGMRRATRSDECQSAVAAPAVDGARDEITGAEYAFATTSVYLQGGVSISSITPCVMEDGKYKSGALEYFASTDSAAVVGEESLSGGATVGTWTSLLGPRKVEWITGSSMDCFLGGTAQGIAWLPTFFVPTGYGLDSNTAATTVQKMRSRPASYIARPNARQLVVIPHGHADAAVLLAHDSNAYEHYSPVERFARVTSSASVEYTIGSPPVSAGVESGVRPDHVAPDFYWDAPPDSYQGEATVSVGTARLRVESTVASLGAAALAEYARKVSQINHDPSKPFSPPDSYPCLIPPEEFGYRDDVVYDLYEPDGETKSLAEINYHALKDFMAGRPSFFEISSRRDGYFAGRFQHLHLESRSMNRNKGLPEISYPSFVGWA